METRHDIGQDSSTARNRPFSRRSLLKMGMTAGGAVVPREQDCVNLLVPVCLSASHVAFGSVRTEPTLMALGHATGVAAALAAIGGTPVQRVDVARLQRRLADDGQPLWP